MKNLNYTQNDFFVSRQIFLIIFSIVFCALQIHANPGRLDLNFPQVLARDANVTAIVIQTDGKILVAGKFSTRGAILRQDVIRLNSDGALDTTFDLGGATDNGSLIRFMKLQTDGKILIAGNINKIGETFVRPILRLNTNGSIDTTFNLIGINVTFVNDLDVQTDGKILISASNLIGTSFVTRLKTDGSYDEETGQTLFFANVGGFGYKVTFIQTENKILVGGNFTYTVNQTQYENLAKLNLNGTIDPNFTANVTNTTFDLIINTKLLDSGKILVWGKFDAVNGVTRRNLAIINSDGSLDSSFNPSTNGSEIFISVAVQADGKIIVGGSNFGFNTFVRGNIVRLNANGSADPTFNQGKGTNADVRALKIRANNKLLFGGTFSRYHIFPRSGLTQVYL